MSIKTKLSFLERARESLPSLHPAERRLAEFLLAFPGDLASYQASELARLANVSNATVSRTIKRLGYATYDEARRHVRADQQSGAALFQISAKQGEDVDLINLHFDQTSRNILRTGHSLLIDEIDELARSLVDARRACFIGFRAGRGLAAYASFQISQIVGHVLDLPAPGQTLAEPLASLGEEDVVVIFGLPRRVAENDAIIEAISKRKAIIAYVTDEKLEKRSDVRWHFRCQTAAPGPLYNHASVLALIHILATRVVELSGGEGRKRLSRVELLHDSLTELES